MSERRKLQELTIKDNFNVRSHRGVFAACILTFFDFCGKKKLSELNMCNRYSAKVTSCFDVQKRIR